MAAIVSPKTVKTFSFAPSYEKANSKSRKSDKKLVTDGSSPWVDSFQVPLKTLEEESEGNSSTQPEDSPRTRAEWIKSKTLSDLKLQLLQVSKSRKKYIHQFRHKRFRLTVFKVLVCMRWTAFYHRSSKDSIQEAKRLYSEMQERRSDYSDEPIDLMFDKSSYKAKTAVRISKETKRILQKPPNERTDEEVFRAQIALGNIKDIAQYPFRMQREIAKFGEYESFGGRRIILRQGHPPSASYFVLSGEMFEIIYENSQSKPKLGQAVVKGDEFGDKAIVDDTYRECTVITKEPTELLCLKKKHFRRIFMLGGGLCVLDSEQKAFLRNLAYMKGFPIEKLEENSEKVKAQYFKKGAMITDDTRYFPWIIIVKTGSVFIYKRLKKVFPIPGNNKESNYDTTEQENKGKREKREKREMTRRQMLSDIHIPVRHNVEIDERIVEQTPGKPEKFIHPSERKDSNISESLSEYLPPTLVKPVNKKNKYSFHSIQDQLLTRTTPPHFEPVKSPLSEVSNDTSVLSSLPSTINKNQNGKGPSTLEDRDDTDLISHKSFLEKTKYKMEEKQNESTTEIVHVNTISNGQIFGLDDIMIDKRIEQRQSFSVFSGGADVIFIDKHFFKEHMSEKFRTRLVKFFCPYPSDEELQEKLQTHVDWNFYKVKTLNNTLFLLEKEMGLKKSQNLF